MAKRPKYSRWRRLPAVFRTGEDKSPDPGLDPTRLTIYPPADLLDRAESQAARLGFETVQDYCAELLSQGVEDERIREQVAEVEARRGTLEGLHEIADDPEYLAELRAATSMARPSTAADSEPMPALSIRLPGLHFSSGTVATDSEPIRAASAVVLRHAAQDGGDSRAFLACLRRGDAVPPDEVAELAQALHDLEIALRSSPSIDRRLTFALHRLAFESQVLHTDAWPGAFDSWTVDVLRAVQEGVERILSGQDIRYSSHESHP